MCWQRPACWALLIVVTWAVSSSVDCWSDCRRTGFYCKDFCCQPIDGIGNVNCWDINGYYSFLSCCSDYVAPVVDEAPTIQIGTASIPLYRGPSDSNSPKFNERTLEVALGLWFMRKYKSHGAPLIEIGNTLRNYWPESEKPWYVYDLKETGVDATMESFTNMSVLSLSTVEHVGMDNEGQSRREGVHLHNTIAAYEAWISAWDASPQLLSRITLEAGIFLVTFPIGFNPRLDAVVARDPSLQQFARVARRIDAANRWEIDPSGSMKYYYDFRDTYALDSVGAIYSSSVPLVFEQVYGEPMPPLQPPPAHPPFRFANGVCIITNVPELLA